MITWIDETVARARHSDMQASERQRALVRAAANAQAAAPHFYNPALAWLGRRMASWGASIEARYTPVAIGPCEGC